MTETLSSLSVSPYRISCFAALPRHHLNRECKTKLIKPLFGKSRDESKKSKNEEVKDSADNLEKETKGTRIKKWVKQVIRRSINQLIKSSPFIHITAGLLLLTSAALPANPTKHNILPPPDSTKQSATFTKKSDSLFKSPASKILTVSRKEAEAKAKALESMSLDLKKLLHQLGWGLLAFNMIPSAALGIAFGRKKNQPGFIGGILGNAALSWVVPFKPEDQIMRWRGGQGVMVAFMAAAFANSEENENLHPSERREVDLSMDSIKREPGKVLKQSIGLIGSDAAVIVRNVTKLLTKPIFSPIETLRMLKRGVKESAEYLRDRREETPEILNSQMILRFQALTSLIISGLLVWAGSNPELVRQLMVTSAITSTPGYLSAIVLAAKKKDWLFLTAIPLDWLIFCPNIQHDWAVALSNMTYWPAQKRHMIRRVTGSNEKTENKKEENSDGLSEK